MSLTVVQYLLNRLNKLGITEIFGVPGDYSFLINDAICQDPNIRWIGCCNELNAAYAADGYARIKGVAAVSTTYGVGELSAINGIAGSYAEHLPVFHIVGMPKMSVQENKGLIHHTLGNGEFDFFYKMTEPVVGAKTILTPDNCIAEVDRVIHEAMTNRYPVYIAIPGDYAEMPVVERAIALIPPLISDPDALTAAIEAILKHLASAKTACILPGIFVNRFGLQAEVVELIEASGLPFATMVMDKTVVDETHPQFIGIYDGRLMQLEIRDFVEGCDSVLLVGSHLTDFNTGFFTAHLDRSKRIEIRHYYVQVGHAVFQNIDGKDVIKALADKISKRTDIKIPKSHGLGEPQGNPQDQIMPEYLYPRYEQFFRPDDIIIAETGASSMGLFFAQMPQGVAFHNQTLWGSIGWATPAALGAAFAAGDRRTILLTGDGSHQLTAQEVGTFARYGLKPIIICINNNGYLIERVLCKDPMSEYNDIAAWNYTQLPVAFGATDWFTAKVTTCGELDAALKQAETCDTGVYIEVVMDFMASPPLMVKINELMQNSYKGQ